MARIKKFNNGAAAILCNKCLAIVEEGFSEDEVDPKRITKADWDSDEPLYCDKCKEKMEKIKK